MNDAENDDSTFAPLTLSAKPVFGLLGDLDAHASAPPLSRPTALDLWAASDFQQIVVGVLEKAPVTVLRKADADAFARLIFQLPADDVADDVTRPPEETPGVEASPAEEAASLSRGVRRATPDDLDAGIRWSAERKEDGLPRWRKGRVPDGRTSGKQLRDDARTWCEQNSILYGKRQDWENQLTAYHSELKRSAGPPRR
jgi:hypothetical protein